MRRYIYLQVLVITLLFGYFVAAEANSIEDPIAFQSLGGKDMPLCLGRVDGDLNDYEDVAEDDGFRWMFVINEEGGKALTTLLIEFVCVDENLGSIGILASHTEVWGCMPTGGGITISKQLLIFDGSGGLLCQGVNVKQATEAVLSHLSLSLPAVFEVNNIFAEGVVMPNRSQGACGLTQPLFSNQNIAYSLPVNASK